MGNSSSTNRYRSNASNPRPRNTSSHSSAPKNNVTMIQCPLCTRSFAQTVIEFHASTCEGRQSPTTTTTSPQSNYFGPIDEEVQIVEEPSQSSNNKTKRMKNGTTVQDDDEVRILNSPTNSSSSKIECPICNQSYS